MLAHKGVRWITFGWSAFIAENVILSHNREYIIERFGEQSYHGFYSTLSTAACLSIGYGYFRYGKNMGPILNDKYWKPQSIPFRIGAFSFQSLGLIGVSQNFPKLQVPVLAQFNTDSTETDILTMESSNGSSTVSPSTSTSGSNGIKFAAQCPIDWTPKDIPSDGIYGLKRVTRHPMLFSLGMFGLGTALKTPFATRAIVYGFPLLFALIGGFHQDYRHRRHSGGYLSPETDQKTSLIPFLALLCGRQNWNELWSEMKHVNMSIAVLVAMYLNMAAVGAA